MKSSRYLYFFLSVSFILFPLLFFKSNDFWDGVNVAYAFESKNYAAIDSYMLQGAYFVQYVVYKIFFGIAEYFNFSFKYLTYFFYALILYLLSIELEKFSKDVLKLNGFFIILPSILVIIFPIWSILVSSIFISHVLFVYFVFLGARLLFYKNAISKFLGILVLIICYELKSNFLFSIVLIFLYELRNYKSIDLKNFKTTIFISIFNIIFFILFSTVFAPSGLWEGHNEFKNLLDWFNFKHLIWNSLMFLTFYYPVFLSAIFLLFFLENKNLKEVIYINKFNQKELLIFLGLVLANLFSILPYILVIKSSIFLVDIEYTPRCAFLLAPSICLLFSYIFNFFYSRIDNIKIVKFNICIIILLFSISSIFLYMHKYNFLKFRYHLLETLKLIKFEPGIVVLNGDGIPYPTMISKESNYLFWKAYNDTKWATHILRDRQIPLPKNFTNPTKEFLLNNGNTIYIAENFEFKCLTKGEIETKSYVGFQNIFYNLFSTNKNEVNIKVKSINCNN